MGLRGTIVVGPRLEAWKLENGMNLRDMHVGKLMDLATASQRERRTMTKREGACLTSRFLSRYLPVQEMAGQA